MIRRSIWLVVVALLSGCSLVSSYQVKGDVNEATFYRARYIDRCVTHRAPDTPCEEWAADQRRLDQAAGEAVDALKVGGRTTLQRAALRRSIVKVRKGFSSWLE